MIWQFDPSDPDGLSQAGTVLSEAPGASIVTAPWSPVGKAYRSTLFASVRASITNIQPGTGGYTGWTIITAPGFGTAYNGCYYRFTGNTSDGTGSTYPGTLCAFGISGALGSALNLVNLWTPGGVQPQGAFPTVIDADTVAAPFNSTGYPAYTSGGTIGLGGGIGTAALTPAANAQLTLSTLYNSNMYLGVYYRVHEGYPLNLGAGAKQFFGALPTFGNSSCYGPLGGVAGDNTASETSGPLGIVWAWSADNGIGGGSNNGQMGAGFTDGHFSYDWSNTGRPDYIARGTPFFAEIFMQADTVGSSNAVAKTWINRTTAGSPDYTRTGFKFSDGTYGFGNFGGRGLTMLELGNTDGGGGVLPDVDKIVDFGYVRLSGGWRSANEKPDHWHATVSNPTPSVGNVVKATFELRDATDTRIRCPVNNTPSRAGGNFGDSSIDLQFNTTNGATWVVDPASDSYGLSVTGETLHASTVPGASYNTAYLGPIQFYTVKFGGVTGVEGVDYSVTNQNYSVDVAALTPATINILPGTALTGAVTIDYNPRGENFNRAGQIAINVTINNVGTTNIQVQSIARANNNQRYGSFLTGSVSVTA
jgi:hypothetical protein